MKNVLLAIAAIYILYGCKQRTDEYEVDQKAYKECIENEPSMDDCVYNYVEYLPENIKKELDQDEY